MEPKAAGLLRKFESIKRHAQRVLDTLDRFEAAQIQAPIKHDIPYEIIREVRYLEPHKVEETKKILEQYRKSSPDVHEIVKISIPHISDPIDIENAKGALHQISIECDNVIGALNALITPLLPEDADKLTNLRAEISSLTTKLDVNYETNLSEAIKEYENRHYLASALITGRVIIYILEQIKVGRPIDEKIKFLQDKNIIEKGTKGEEVKAFIMKASKKARNIFSHNIDRFAQPSDALGMLGDSVKLLGIFATLKG